MGEKTREEKEEEMTEIEGCKDYYQHLLNSLKAVLRERGIYVSVSYSIDELVENEIDKCLKDYGVDWRLDEDEEKRK